MGQFFGSFSNTEEVLGAFGVSDFEGQILVAQYDCGDYEGSASVLLRGADGLLYEVYGSHCSCYGLENQWSPELVEANELRQRMLGRPDEFSLAVVGLLPPVAES